MESLNQISSSDIQRSIRIIKMIEVVIRRCVSPKFKVSNQQNFIPNVTSGLGLFQNICYPMGISDERIVDFVTYQIYRYRDMIMMPGKRFGISWVFSLAAVDKYNKQFVIKGAKTGMRYYINEWLEDADLSVDELISMIRPPQEHPMRKYIYQPSEEPTKRRWINTEMGLLLCQKATTGWSPQSSNCSRCIYTEQCIKLSKQKYPELIRLRKESQNG